MIFSALKPVILRDSDSFRQNIFSELKLRSITVRFAEKLYLRSSPALRSALLLAYGIKSFLEAPQLTGNICCLYCYQNERIRFEYLRDVFGTRTLELCKISACTKFLEKFFYLMIYISDLPRLIRLLNFISKRFDFLVSCRISSTIFFYSWFESEIKRKKPQAVLLSSEANPYSMALLWAARKMAIPSIYVPHGQVSPRPPRLFFDLSLLDGEVLKTTFEENGAPTGQIIFKGTDGEFVPLKTEGLASPQTVGVFLSLIYNTSELEKVIRKIHIRYPESAILIRLHPNESISSSEILGRLKDLKILTNRNNSLAEDISACDIIFCGNSGTHLEALRQGIPTIQLPGLDLFPHDSRRFIEYKIVPWFTDPEHINSSELKAFFSTEWIKQIKKYDHYYGCSKKQRDQILRDEIDTWFRARLGTSDNVQKIPGKKT